MQKIKDGFKNERFYTIPRTYWAEEQLPDFARNLYVTYLGYFPHAEYHYIHRPYGVQDNILFYCRKGSGQIQISSQDAFMLGQGQTTLLPAQTRHTYQASANDPWSLFWIHLNGNMVQELCKYGLFVPSSKKYLSSAGCRVLDNLFQECFDALKPGYTPIAYYHVCQIAAHILTHICTAATDVSFSQKGEAAIETVHAYMKENLHRSLSLKELADACGYSPSYLSKLFRQLKQASPIDYFLQMKIQAASKELFFSAAPVKEIALKYGFTDPLYFSRQFKNTFGISPSVYREYFGSF